jgi:hypothetical protein
VARGTSERSRQYSKQHARAGIPAVAQYGEYEEVTTGGNDRWPYARWDFSHFAPFYRGLSEYARGRARSCARAELGGTRTGRRSGPSPEPSARRAGRGGRDGVVRRHSGIGPKSGRIIPAIRRFTDSRRPGHTRSASEPVWPGGPALVSGGSPGAPQRLAHDVEDGFLRLGGRPGLRRTDTSLVDVVSSGMSGSPSAATLAMAHRPNTRSETSPLSSSSRCSCRLS